MEACCTCATLLSSAPRDSEAEKPLPPERRLPCCARVICGRCIQTNPRFASYCPYCQISSAPSALPQGLREPPSYASATASAASDAGAPPPYAPRFAPARDPAPVYADEKAGAGAAAGAEGGDAEAGQRPRPPDDLLHFLDHDRDTVASLSLRYGVPAAVLRAANKLPSDHLLLARRTVLIPGAWLRGGAVSLSPRPVEGEDEERRKAKIRRFMVGCKVAEYDVAVLYLAQAGYDLDAATEAYFADEAWEKAHPLQDRGGRPKGKGGSAGTGPGRSSLYRRRA